MIICQNRIKIQKRVYLLQNNKLKIHYNKLNNYQICCCRIIMKDNKSNNNPNNK